MRFLILFFKFLTAILLGVTIFAFVGREVWLSFAAYQVSAAAGKLSQPERLGRYIAGCTGSFGTEGEVHAGFQVRFIDDRQYATEVRCTAQDPVEIASAALPWGVRKTTGSAGFYLDAATNTLGGEITLEFMGRTRIVYSQDTAIKTGGGTTELRSELPVSYCIAHGLRCCDATDQKGVGALQSSGVIDCPAQCYQSCLQRPLLLSFQSDPPADPETQISVVTGSPALVTFAYNFDGVESDIQEVVIQFGDGTEKRLNEASGRTEKEYFCPANTSCTFVVSVTAYDSRGVESATSRLSSMTLVLNP